MRPPRLSRDRQAVPLAPELVVPGDIGAAQTAYGVQQLTIAVESPTRGPADAEPAGPLPGRRADPQTHTEIGPTLGRLDFLGLALPLPW